MVEFPYNLPRNLIQLRPDVRGQAAAHGRDFFRMRVPTVMQPALDYLASFYLITKELQSGLPVMSARAQRAVHGLEDFTLADRVIDGPVTHVLNHRDILGNDEALHDEFQEIADRTLTWSAAVRNNGLVAHGEQFL